MKQTLEYLLIILFFSSCFPNLEKKEINYDYFLTQKSLDGKYIIYNYYRPGMMAFSGDISGTQIQKIGEQFSERSGIELNGEILSYIGIDTLLVYRKKLGRQPTDTIAKIKYEKVYDLTLKILDYDGHNGGISRELYFNELEVSNEKIIFKEVSSRTGKEFDDIEMDLGSVILEFHSDTISKVSYKKLKMSMNGRFKNEDGTFNENLPSVKKETTSLIPKSKFYKMKFKDLNGIYYNE